MGGEIEQLFPGTQGPIVLFLITVQPVHSLIQFMGPFQFCMNFE